MLTEFVGVQLTRSELQEIHLALIKQALIQDEIRRERGLEEIEGRPLLERMERLLGLNEEQAHAIDHVTLDELWEYSWYSFTEEWAWYRAEQELEKTKKIKTTSQEDHQKMIETLYQKHFQRYVSEVAMVEGEQARKAKISRS